MRFLSLFSPTSWGAKFQTCIVFNLVHQKWWHKLRCLLLVQNAPKTLGHRLRWRPKEILSHIVSYEVITRSAKTSISPCFWAVFIAAICVHISFCDLYVHTVGQISQMFCCGVLGHLVSNRKGVVSNTPPLPRLFALWKMPWSARAKTYDTFTLKGNEETWRDSDDALNRQFNSIRENDYLKLLG